MKKTVKQSKQTLAKQMPQKMKLHRIAKRIQHGTIGLLKVGHIGLQALMISASYDQLKRDIECNRYIHTLTFKDANYMVAQGISIATLAFAICHSAQSSWQSFKKAFEKTVVTSSPITSP